MFARFTADCQHPAAGPSFLRPTLEEKQSRPSDSVPLLVMVQMDSVIKASSLITDICAIQVTFLQLYYSAIIGFLVLIGP